MTFSVKPLQEDVEQFVERLYGRGWVHAAVLVTELGINKRHLRALAEGSHGRVISGNKGYHVTAEASQQEVDTCETRLGSQARKTLLRCLKIRRAFQDSRITACNPY